MSSASSTTTAARGKAVSKDSCANCGSTDVVVCSDGVSAARRCWCQAHKPVNLPVNASG